MRSLGLSLRPDGFDFVLFDGNAKKYKVATAGSGHLHEDKDLAKGLGKGIAAALKKSGAGKVGKLSLCELLCPNPSGQGSRERGPPPPPTCNSA